MSSPSAAPVTWVDVARRFAELEASTIGAPSSLIRARVDWDAVILEASSRPKYDEIESWLEQLFPSRLIKDGQLSISLDGPSHALTLPVEIIVEQDGDVNRPSFGIIDGVISFSTPDQKRDPLPVPLIAVQSVKGGTGRTSTAIALAVRWAERIGRPILLVDADLEAPGISYLFREAQREPRVALEDIVALAHSETASEFPETIAFASEKLKDHLLGGKIVILPLRRNLDELASSVIRPEHLSTPNHPFALADLLAQIALKSGCAGVVVDVRAGLVPIGANLGLDPEVAPVLVTTLSDQALQATGALVRFFSREIRRAGGKPRSPLLVVNRVPSVFQHAGVDQKLIDPLVSSMIESLMEGRRADVGADESILTDPLDIDPISVVRVGEIPDLQVSSRGWTEFVNQLEVSGFSRKFSEADTWLTTEAGATNAAPATISSIPTLAERRQKLHKFADSLIAAENVSGPVPKPLVTQSLAALAQRFRSEAPIAISEGGKGTGKTLNARFLVSQESWDKAVQQLAPGEATAVPALIVPVCGSIQSSAALQSEFDHQRKIAAKSLSLGSPQSIADTISWLKTHRVKKSKQSWAERWLDIIAWSSGFEVGKADVGPKFIEVLRAKRLSVVAVFEGLEELYGSPSSEGVSEMMGGLLIDLPQRLRTESGRPLGCVAYVRRDTVEAALRQNIEQYRREYAPFALTWTDDDVLELAAWLATQAEALPSLWDPTFREKSVSAKSAELESLWGRKLGPDDTPGKPRIKEAYTATWVIAVLSDLQGRLVPRDLVRLLANASKALTSEEDSIYSGRLLTPGALRQAVEPTSEKKVSETEEEIAGLKGIFDKFRKKAETVAAPLTEESLKLLGIGTADLENLKAQGVVFGDAAPYEVPELYRRGLRLRHSGARHSVVNLYRRARQRSRSFL